MQVKPLAQTKLSKIETESVDFEIIQLLKIKVIQPCQHEAGRDLFIYLYMALFA